MSGINFLTIIIPDQTKGLQETQTANMPAEIINRQPAKAVTHLLLILIAFSAQIQSGLPL